MSHDLLRVLSAMMPKADISLIAERPWHSLTFAGSQISFKATLSGEDHAAIAAKLTGRLPEQDFDIPEYLVADIAVTEQVADEKQTRLTIDALLLED